MLAAAVCTALLIGYLSVLSTQLVNEGGELPLLDDEQTYDCPDLGLRIRIPAGYTAVEEEAEPGPTPVTRCTSSTANGSSTSTPYKT